jgi:D-aspartate ligase
VYGKYPAWPCHRSRIMHYTANSRADEQDTFFSLVTGFAKEHQDKKVLLLGCGDSYVQLISANLDRLPDNVIAPISTST